MIHIVIAFLILSVTLVSLAAVSYASPGVANASGSFLAATIVTVVSSIAMLWLVRRDRL